MKSTKTTERINPNSALHWLPAAEDAVMGDVRVPDTEVVEFDFMESLSILTGDSNPDEMPWGDLDTAACALGWPVFIRTDLTSAKHSGLDAVQADNADAVNIVVDELMRDCAQKSMHPSAFLVREWVNIGSRFTAFDGLPIGVEYRVFAGPDDVQCAHYYWPEDSIRKANLPDDEWRRHRDEMADVPLPSVVRSTATAAAERANRRHSELDPLEVWSVDFARDVDGDWWLIDMALAANSWHPDCPYANGVSHTR